MSCLICCPRLQPHLLPRAGGQLAAASPALLLKTEVCIPVSGQAVWGQEEEFSERVLTATGMSSAHILEAPQGPGITACSITKWAASGDTPNRLPRGHTARGDASVRSLWPQQVPAEGRGGLCPKAGERVPTAPTWTEGHRGPPQPPEAAHGRSV